MKVTINVNKPERTIIALVDISGEYIWLRDANKVDGAIIINKWGGAKTVSNSFTEVHKNNPDATPIFEGDSITISF